jgi:UPF0755 protein
MVPMGTSRTKASPMRRAFRIFVLTLFLFVGGGAFVGYQMFTYPDGISGTASGTVELTIERGATARQVADAVAAKGLVDNPTWFRLYATQRGAASRFKAGRYEIPAPITPRGLIDLFVKGAADQLVAVTVPEGKHMLEVVDLLAQAGIADRKALRDKVLDARFAHELGLPGKSLEGYLYPDTYKFRLGTPADKVLLVLVRRHREVFEALRAQNTEGLRDLRTRLEWSDPQIVIMASIVEKETGQPEERPRIAQVFINRLLFPTFVPKLLQTDPTIVYGCTVGPKILGTASKACEQFIDRIRRIHLDDKDNPYSTYAHEGLPPGPIANPGREALEAVMKPDGTKYLYFVARNDGTHQFSATVAEHDAAVVKYQRGGKPLSK